jgi:hypothetical protein
VYESSPNFKVSLVSKYFRLLREEVELRHLTSKASHAKPTLLRLLPQALGNNFEFDLKLRPTIKRNRQQVLSRTKILNGRELANAEKLRGMGNDRVLSNRGDSKDLAFASVEGGEGQGVDLEGSL